MRKLFVVIAIVVMAAQLFMISSLISGPSRADAAVVNNCACLTTLPATNIGTNGATLNGYADVTCLRVNCEVISFLYGAQPNLLTMETSTVTVSASGPIAIPVSGLSPCTMYYYQIKAVPCAIPRLPGVTPGYLAGYDISACGAGIGLKPAYHPDILEVAAALNCPVLSFTTLGCQIHTGSSGGGVNGSVSGGIPGAPAGTPATRPFLQMSAISVKSATISNPRVGPGQPVDVKANITNSGVANGVAKITVYVNGVEESAQPTTLASGQTVTLDFSVTRNEPGTYSVIVNNVPAGSFTVELFNSNDMLIYGSIALFVVGFGGVLYMLTRKRKTA